MHSVEKFPPVRMYLMPCFSANLYIVAKKAWSCGMSMCGTPDLKNASCRSRISSQSMTSVYRSSPSSSTSFSMLFTAISRVPAAVDVEDQRAQAELLHGEVSR